MARNRMLNPEFWLDEGIAELTAYARLLYMGLWGICDDNYATLPNRPKWIKAQVFPYDNVDIEGLLDELSTSGKIVLFTDVEGQEYYFIKNFFKHQKVDRPSKPKYPKYEAENAIVNEESSSNRPEVKLSEVKLSEVKLSEVNSAVQKPQTYGNQDINEILLHMKEQFQLEVLDLSEKRNRYAAQNLLRKYKTLEAVKSLIEMAALDEFWGKNISSVEGLLNNAMKIYQRAKGDRDKVAVQT